MEWSRNKQMFERFYPDEVCDSIYSYDFEKLYNEGMRGILFDIDNTIVPHGFPADDRAIGFFEKLRKIGYSFIVISNNKEPRVAPFADAVNCPYIYKANKPSVKGYKKALETIKLTEKECIFVGDQLFTDIWGAKKAGIRTLLTKPIHPKEEIQIVIKRFFEKIVMSGYYKKRQK